jgi:hypothetical protein
VKATQEKRAPRSAAADGPHEADRGRAAEQPSQIPAKGWKDILLRTKQQMAEDNLSIIAAGVAFPLSIERPPLVARARKYNTASRSKNCGHRQLRHMRRGADWSSKQRTVVQPQD